MTAQVGITPPRTKGTSAALKTPGRPLTKHDQNWKQSTVTVSGGVHLVVSKFSLINTEY